LHGKIQTLTYAEIRIGLDFFLRLASEFFEQAARLDIING